MLSSGAMLAAVPLAYATQPPAFVPQTFVLVHGSWHGGWCYARVERILRSMGHKVFSLTLSGLGERSHLLSPQIDLKTHVDDVVNFVRWRDLDSISLVGHSYGGIVVTGATEMLRQRVRSLVFLDAFIPSAGESLLDMSAPDSRARMEALASNSKGLYIDPIPARIFGVNAVDQAWVDSKCTAHPYVTFKQSLTSCEAIYDVKSKLFVRSSFPNTRFDATANRFKADAGWQVAYLRCGHDMMIDEAKGTAALLADTA